MRILFLCTGNSCRSQMAEGFTRHFSDGRIAVGSAGIEAHGLNPRAVAVMSELGIDISRQESKVVAEPMIDSADLIITVCDHAKEHCPVIPVRKRQIHWSFDDPAGATGNEEQIHNVFCRVRDEIAAKVRELVAREMAPGRVA